MFSRTKATVRQVIRSVIRDCAVWMIGALWPSSRPATTTEMTPEACTLLRGDERGERREERDRGVQQRVA